MRLYPHAYPWLRGHGSIEALASSYARRRRRLYPWLRGHGSIEAPQCDSDWGWDREYPWLRGHGSIEAQQLFSMRRNNVRRIHG